MQDRELALRLSDAELAQRARERPVAAPSAARGCRRLYLQSVTQADPGADFDFLQAAQVVGKVPRPRWS